MDTNTTEQEINELAARIEENAVHPEQEADYLAETLELTDDNAEKTRTVVADFVVAYKQKDVHITDTEYLVAQFSKYPTLWKDEGEKRQHAEEIVKAVTDYEAAKIDLREHFKKGGSKESWLAQKIEQGAAGSGAASVGAYAGTIDTAIEGANQAMSRALHRNYDGLINQNPNLDGFIAERYHVDTFNMDAAAKNSGFYAEAQNSTASNSVDIFIKNSRGGIVRKYQSKYGADAETTQSYFDEGGYRFQRKLVPAGQAEAVPSGTDKIEFQGVSSKPLSKEEAKVRQQAAQQKGEIREYDWNEVSRVAVAKSIGQKAGVSALLAVGFQGARVLGRRIWNGITGKPNKPIAEDVQEFAKSAIESGATAGVTVAVSGGLTVAARSGWLGNALKATPAGRIAAAACVAVENAKILYKYAKGEISGIEALDQAGNATCSVVGSLALGAKGAALGGAIGTVLGPVGTVVGGIAGGIIGGIAGSAVGEAIYTAGKKIVSAVATGVKALGNTIKKGITAVGGFFKRLFA